VVAEGENNVAESGSEDKVVSPYEMSIDLRILNHLGIHLYSNVAAVLSEAVANAWDAEATEVLINISADRIVIQDNGFGMGKQQINERFLNVGYDKRKAEGDVSPVKKRPHMGRKGIGKLSLFSIADQADVYTSNGSEQHAFQMVLDDIRLAIEAHETYHPKPITFEPVSGTKIVLSGLKRKRTTRTDTALRKRIARRFSIIGRPKADDDFVVKINGSPVTSNDREDLKRLEFIWEFGDKPTIEDAALPFVRKRECFSGDVDGAKGWVVTGWIGAVSEPKQLTTDDAGPLNNIVVLARGRLIQENVLDKINYSRIFTKYLTGEINADFLDRTDCDDIATSDRQRLIEDDERYEALLAFVRRKLLDIDDVWTKWRNEERGKDAVKEVPGLVAWVESLPASQQTAANRLLGLVRSVELDDERQRTQLYKAGVVAFERLRLRETAHQLGESDALSAQSLLPLLADLESLEGSMYRDIVVSRLDVIKKLEQLVDQNEKEKLLQKHLFDKLWLLDPAWERAAGSDRMEKRLKSDYSEFSPTLTDEESKGRYDIRYRTNGGLHILVELKRADRQMRVPELLEQGQKYVSALRKCLAAAGEENPNIALVFVLGRPVYEAEEPYLGGQSYVDNQLKGLGARVVYYEQLIRGAHAGYAEFIEQSERADKLDLIVKAIEGRSVKLDPLVVDAGATEASVESPEASSLSGILTAGVKAEGER